MLEQLGDAKEQGSGLLCCERLADIEQKHDPSQKRSTFPRGDGRFIEYSSFLDHDGLVVVEG